ncbi:uncharacterized protein LOC144065711 [Stigmatopora argus]
MQTIITRRVSFRSLQSTFSNQLFNQSSSAFLFRSTLIRSQLQPLFQMEFPSIFRVLVVIGFRPGSVINDMDLSFVNVAPNHTAITAVLIEAVPLVSGFDIEQSSITVEGIVSRGVTYNTGLLCTFSMVAFSWMLSSQH